MTGTDPIAHYWAKTAQQGLDTWHPVAYHNLDVAAAGRALLEMRPFLRQRLSMLLDTDETALVEWLTFLMALHDIGKFADGFQGLVPELMQRLQGRVAEKPYGRREGLSHDRFGLLAWQLQLLPDILAERVNWPVGKGKKRRLLSKWVQPIFGHHGYPVAGEAVKPLFREQFPEDVQHAMGSLVGGLAELLLPASVPFVDASRVKRASWLIAGWAVVADWLGSNTTWFPFLCPEQEEPLSLEDYWHHRALPSARSAVCQADLNLSPPTKGAGLHALFNPTWTPTELQQAAEDIAMGSEPQLIIIEELTGGGKTEAALILAHRMLQQEAAQGVYIALPTMATANAMFDRVNKLTDKLFANSPTTTLAHSGAKLRDVLASFAPDAENGPESQTSSTSARSWLNDSRKLALLSQLGVGTVDQALLAVLPVFHQSLRVFGLHDSVLIVDEVHACDVYVRELLQAVLTLHASMGGSAILLSATLPQQQRQGFCDAFCKGLEGSNEHVLENYEYPLLTRVSAEAVDEQHVASRQISSRRVDVEALFDEDEVYQRISAELESGRCVCWIRNTVAQAVESYERLRARDPQRTLLFHSRFTVGDRAGIEADVIARFGDESTETTRRGWLLVATQVVEQSLDIDFDVMVTDLAPIDLVIQRAGRLCRHTRDVRGNRSREEQRGTPTLLLHTPRPDEDATHNWYSDVLGNAAYVYPDHSQLWLTAGWLIEKGGFTLPADSRAMIEAVYGTEMDYPEGLSKRVMDAWGEQRAERDMAVSNQLVLSSGYCDSHQGWLRDDRTPTRLGEPTVTVRLARREETGLSPWFGNKVPRFAWELSQVRVRARQLSQPVESDELTQLTDSMFDEGQYVVTVILRPDGEIWRGQGRDADGNEVEITYDQQRGLSVG